MAVFALATLWIPTRFALVSQLRLFHTAFPLVLVSTVRGCFSLVVLLLPQPRTDIPVLDPPVDSFSRHIEGENGPLLDSGFVPGAQF